MRFQETAHGGIACCSRPQGSNEHPGRPGPDQRAARHVVIFCRDDPFLTDPATAFVCEPDGLVICRDGVIDAVGPVAAIKARAAAGHDHRRLSRLPDRAGLHRHAHPLRADRHHRLARRAAARLARALHLRRRAGVRRSAAHAAATAQVFCDELLRNGTTTALVFCSVHPRLGRCAVRRGRSGATCASIAGKVLMDRNAPAALRDTAQSRLRPIEGADRALARPRPRALCDHAALCRHQHAGAARRRGRAVARASRRAHADPHRGEPPRDRMDRGALPGAAATISTSTTTTA